MLAMAIILACLSVLWLLISFLAASGLPAPSVQADDPFPIFFLGIGVSAAFLILHLFGV